MQLEASHAFFDNSSMISLPTEGTVGCHNCLFKINPCKKSRYWKFRIKEKYLEVGSSNLSTILCFCQWHKRPLSSTLLISVLWSLGKRDHEVILF